MPELPEVETVRRGLEPVMVGQRIERVELRRKDLRFPFPPKFAERLLGQRVEALTRRAKYMLAELSSGETLIMHLGMTGRFTILKSDGGVGTPGVFYDDTASPETGDGKHDHVVLHMGDGTRVVYADPRRFGFMELQAAGVQHKLLAGIGVEPLGNGLNADYLAEKFLSKSAPLKAALLDQRIIAGLGNIYVCEALHRAGLSPARKAGTMAKKREAQLEALVRHIRDILEEAIRVGGSTLQDYRSADGAEGAFQERFRVYDREGEPCHACAAPIKRIVQSGRSTFYCARCQK